MAGESSNKRRLSTSDGGLDRTPRAAAAPGASLIPSATSSRISGASSSSAKRQKRTLQLTDDGIEVKALRVDRPPVPGAHALMYSMRYPARGIGILPHHLQPAILRELMARGLDPMEWQYSFQPAGHVDRLPGRIPCFNEVDRIYRKATECQQDGHERVCWSGQVHLGLLEGVFECARGPCAVVGALACTSARPHRQFGSLPSPAKMVDICVYVSPALLQPDWTARVEAFSRRSPTLTVNHTDFAALASRPIMFSIVTTKPGVDWDMAQLQMGAWHAAQWKFLAWAVGQKLARQATEHEVKTEPDEGNEAHKGDDPKAQVQGVEAKKAAALAELGFLPGIIVQGHQWHLVLSTFDAKSGKTTLWADQLFGTTQGPLAIYATVASVRRLTGWATDVYLRWLAAHVLD